MPFYIRNEVDIPDNLQDDLKKSLEGVSAVVAKYDPGLHILNDEIDRVRQSEASHEDGDPMKDVLREWFAKVRPQFPNIDVRVTNGSYTVTNYLEESSKNYKSVGEGPRRAKQKIATVRSESPFFKLFLAIKRLVTTGKCGSPMTKETKVVIDGINLVMEPGKMYLILGAPGCGKSTLMKMIAGILPQSKDNVVGGSVSVNGIMRGAKNIIWSNLVAYIDQIDRLHARMTVAETLEFAWRCRSGGTHDKPFFAKDEEAKKAVATADEELFFINKVMEGFGLARVRDTFVGDQQSVRGVSGGEKKRVTVGEMFMLQSPVLCCDEISTGLDGKSSAFLILFKTVAHEPTVCLFGLLAATTHDIVKLIKHGGQMTQTCKIVSLLQPPPGVVALFDEIVLLSEGRIIYCGPADGIIDHFTSLGYSLPERMDIADWLQQLPTPDGAQFLTDKSESAKHLSTMEFKERFDKSELGLKIKQKQDAPCNHYPECVMAGLSKRYHNSPLASLKLLVGRELLLWRRDVPAIRAKIAQDLIMGNVVGTLFWQIDQPQSVMGVLFQVGPANVLPSGAS